MNPVIIRNLVDTWVNQARAGKDYGNGAKLFLRSAATNLQRHAFLYFLKPWPPGVTLTRARLKFYNGALWPGSNTVTGQRAAAKWDINTINYTNMPGVAAGNSSLTKVDAPAESLWDMDVLSLLQPVTDSNWFGIRLAGNNDAIRWIHSTQSANGDLRPVLEVEWSQAPDVPDGLKPSGGRAVSIAKPYFTFNFNDVLGDTSMAALQLEIGSTQALVNGNAAEWKSGELAALAPELNSAASTYPGAALGATPWWRVMAKDGGGEWSPFSSAVQFARIAKGTLTINVPSVYNPTPIITWTFTGTVQRHYQVDVALAVTPHNVLWTTGMLTGTGSSVGVPLGVIKDASLTYVVTVRIWDTVDREDTPGDPSYIEATQNFTVAYDATVAPATGLTAASDPVLPIMTLNWSRSVVPGSWAVMRRVVGSVPWLYIDEVDGAGASVGGTNYQYKDTNASPYKQYEWRVLPVVNDRQSDTNPVISGEVRHIAPFLMGVDGSDPVVFLNPKRSRRNLDVQELHEPLNGPPVVVTQRLGGKAGSVEGLLTGDALPGVSADEMYARFERHHETTGIPVIVTTANQSFHAVAYNFQDDVIADAAGIMYSASFDWVEVPRR